MADMSCSGSALAISIPTVVAGSAIVLALIERFPIIVWAGGAVLGWVAGELLVSDPVVASRMSALAAVHLDVNSAILEATRHFADQLSLNLTELVFGTLGAIVVIAAGAIWRRARAVAQPENPGGADKHPGSGDAT